MADLWKQAEESRFGITPIFLMFVSCMGGWAAAFGANYEVLQLSLVTFPTMLVVTLILGVAPMKPIIYAGAFAVLMDLLVLIF